LLGASSYTELVAMFYGEIVYGTRASDADLTVIGRHMVEQ
jgi:hypothetical protein